MRSLEWAMGGEKGGECVFVAACFFFIITSPPPAPHTLIHPHCTHCNHGPRTPHASVTPRTALAAFLAAAMWGSSGSGVAMVGARPTPAASHANPCCDQPCDQRPLLAQAVGHGVHVFDVVARDEGVGEGRALARAGGE